MRDPVDSRGLLALHAVLESGSAAAAAERLEWSHPTIDHHVRKLERRLGARLLERTPRGSSPTPVGAFVGERAREILALCARLEVDVEVFRDRQEVPVRFGAVPTLGARLLPAVHARLSRLSRLGGADDGAWGASSSSSSSSARASGPRADAASHPRRDDGRASKGDAKDAAPRPADEARPARPVALEATLAEVTSLADLLDRGAIDLAVLFSIAGDRLGLGENVLVQRLYSERMFLCVRADHPVEFSADRMVGDLAELRDERWAFGVDDLDPVDSAMRALCRAAGFEADTGMRTDDYPAVLRMVASGLAVAAVPESALDDAPGGIRATPFPVSVLRRDVVLAVRAPGAAASRRAAGGRAADEVDVAANLHAEAVAAVVREVRAVARSFADSAAGADADAGAGADAG